MVAGPTQELGIRGFKDAFINASTEMPDYGSKIVGKEMTTDALGELYYLLSDLIPTQPIEDVGGVPVDSIAVVASKQFLTHQYGLAVVLSDKQLRTDLSGLLKTVPKLLAQSDYYAKQQLEADLINDGATAAVTGIDTVCLFSTAHPIGNSQTWSNISTAETLSYASSEKLLVGMKNHKTWKGNPWTSWGGWNLVTSGLGVVSYIAKRILSTDKVAGSADNDKNVTKDDLTYAGGNQFLSSTTRYTAIPRERNRNPLFLLTGMELKAVKDPKPSEFRVIYAVASDRTAGWLCAQGIQTNAGA